MASTPLPGFIKYKHFTVTAKFQQVYRFRYITYFLFLLFTLFLLGASSSSSAQDKLQKKVEQPVTDTAAPDMISLLKKMGKDEAQKSALKYQEDQIALRQSELLEEIRNTSQKAKFYLKKGIDSAEIETELENINKWMNIAGEGIFFNKAPVQTHRNLATTAKLINELLKKTTVLKTKTDQYENYLVGFRSRLDSLSTDTALYTFSTDTAVFASYFQKLITASLEIRQPDSALKNAVKKVQELQAMVDLTVFILLSNIEEVDEMEKKLSDKIFKSNLHEPGLKVFSDKSFSNIIKYSKAKGNLTLLFYVQNNLVKIFFLLLLTVLLTIFLRGLKRRLKDDRFSITIDSEKLFLKNTLLCSMIIILNLFQFIFTDPPFIFNVLFWIISAFALIIIMWRIITKFWMIIWLIMFLLFLIATADNVILQASTTERWGMLLLSLAGVIIGSVVLFSKRKNELKEKWILYLIGLLVIMEFSACIANLSGRYDLSKSLTTSGYFNVIIGILFLWTIRFINECLSIASHVFVGPEKSLRYFNFERVGKKVPTLFYVLLVTGWVILLGRNFYSFNLLTRPIRNFFLDERTIGNYTFTISNVVVFFFIMAISVIASKIISFFATDQHHSGRSGSDDKKPGVGSWILLIRISIISLGLFLAFAAAGIPMDRITIILGALGVGIGLGLQALVNNLVSGLIIAFEKPVNVGDIVEIGGQSGTMKSIGFRSSVISTWDGADMIIPNGDLLNAHLVNWTLSGSMRRVELLVGVAYKTDLEKAKQVLNELFLADERILKIPAPSVIFKEFNTSSIDLRVLFWVNKYGDWAITKSDLISAIDIAFKKYEISFPQQDIYIKESPDLNKEK